MNLVIEARPVEVTQRNGTELQFPSMRQCCLHYNITYTQLRRWCTRAIHVSRGPFFGYLFRFTEAHSEAIQ